MCLTWTTVIPWLLYWEVEEPSNWPEDLSVRNTLLVPASHWKEAFLNRTRQGSCLWVLWESGAGATLTLAVGNDLPSHWGLEVSLPSPAPWGPFPGLVPWQSWPCAPAQLCTASEAFSCLWASRLGLFKSLRRKVLWSRGHLPFQPTWLPSNTGQTAWGYGQFLPPKAGLLRGHYTTSWWEQHLFISLLLACLYLQAGNSLLCGFFNSSILRIHSCVSFRYTT